MPPRIYFNGNDALRMVIPYIYSLKDAEKRKSLRLFRAHGVDSHLNI